MKEGKVSIALSLAGFLILVCLLILGKKMELNTSMLAFICFMGMELAALISGVLSRREIFGKLAAVLASLLLIFGFIDSPYLWH